MKRFMQIIIVATLALAACFAIGCSQPTTPSAVTAQVLDKFKAQDFVSLPSHFSGDIQQTGQELADSMPGSGDVDLSQVSLEDLLAAKQLVDVVTDIDYELGAEQIDGDTATVEATITSHELGELVGAALGDYFTNGFAAALNGASQEELSQMFLDSLTTAAAAQTEKTHTSTTTVHLAQVEGEWKVSELTADNVDCLFGGVISYLRQIAGSLISLGNAA